MQSPWIIFSYVAFTYYIVVFESLLYAPPTPTSESGVPKDNEDKANASENPKEDDYLHIQYVKYCLYFVHICLGMASWSFYKTAKTGNKNRDFIVWYVPVDDGLHAHRLWYQIRSSPFEFLEAILLPDSYLFEIINYIIDHSSSDSTDGGEVPTFFAEQMAREQPQLQNTQEKSRKGNYILNDYDSCSYRIKKQRKSYFERNPIIENQ